MKEKHNLSDDAVTRLVFAESRLGVGIGCEGHSKRLAFF
jgi:hypothetical protein